MISKVYEFQCDVCKKTHIGTKAPDGWIRLIASYTIEDYGHRQQHPSKIDVCNKCKDGQRKKFTLQGMRDISEAKIYDNKWC